MFMFKAHWKELVVLVIVAIIIFLELPIDTQAVLGGIL